MGTNPQESRSVPGKHDAENVDVLGASGKRGKVRIGDAEACCVYFLAGGGLIKIGCSTQLDKRVRAIRNSSPIPVELIGHMQGGSFVEGWLHLQFAHLRRHGEWFEDCAELREEIARRLTSLGSFGTEEHCAFGGAL
jgi:hypothetical protein